MSRAVLHGEERSVSLISFDQYQYMGVMRDSSNVPENAVACRHANTFPIVSFYRTLY
jgi:hypothetical protein